MMPNVKGTLFIALIVFSCVTLRAQETMEEDMAEGLRSSGKIYVVVAVLAIIFLGIILYLAGIDRRLKKMEKQAGEKKRRE